MSSESRPKRARLISTKSNLPPRERVSALTGQARLDTNLSQTSHPSQYQRQPRLRPQPQPQLQPHSQLQTHQGFGTLSNDLDLGGPSFLLRGLYSSPCLTHAAHADVRTQLDQTSYTSVNDSGLSLHGDSIPDGVGLEMPVPNGNTDNPSAPLSDDLDDYWYALTHLEMVLRLDDKLFVFQDWDSEHQCLKIGKYEHISFLPEGPATFTVSCTCPSYKTREDCRHCHIFVRYHVDCMLLECIVRAPLPDAVLLHVTPYRKKYIFSSTSGSSSERYHSTKRAIVSLRKDGRWQCDSCGFSDSCKHRPQAKAFLVKAKFIEDGAEEVEDDGNDLDEGEDEEDELLGRAISGRGDVGARGSVSHIMVLPPRWCASPHEMAYFVPKVDPMQMSTFPINPISARCSCGLSLVDAQNLHHMDLLPATFQPAILFHTAFSSEVVVEVVPCPRCRHARRHIGPDLSEFGIFNWNNTMLFTHDLLNEYTSTYTASETPFSAFCLTRRRAYEEQSASMKFCSNETFVRVWFSFVKLQALDSGMACSTCGDQPDIVIADGISLGTHVSKVTSHVKPPTFLDTQSERIESISSYIAQCLPTIPKQTERNFVKKILNLTSGAYTLDAVTHEVNASTIPSKHPELYNFILLYISIGCNNDLRPLLFKSYRNLLEQISAPDIVLQLVPYRAIDTLNKIKDTGIVPDWFQRDFPAFGVVAEVHRRSHTDLPAALRVLAGWLASRATEVYMRLARHDPSPPNYNLQSAASQDWYKTGTYYGLPAVRSRRRYAKLNHDGSTLDRAAEQMGDCNKFYKTYSKNNLTGGIMVLWCRHSICLGFHSIPTAEGRNDVEYSFDGYRPILTTPSFMSILS
ncbi:hypothetical protein VNI00_008192 [Paramarasmius palmivorus]|uniref:HMG domain-containing protein n=1 Tax=Paramarasmius palmivorus TaxID=297713 RepID=A0AAW0CYL9_9AGAR